MKKNYLILMLAAVCCLQGMAQTKKQTGSQFGIRAGYVIPRLAGEKNVDFKPGSKNGFTVSLSYAPAARTGIGFRSEVVFTSQNFSFTADGKKSAIKQQYLYLPQFTTIGIGKFVQLHVGGQIGFLLNANQSGDGKSKESISSVMNKLDYGAAGGLEIYPFKGLILGGRYNMNFGKDYKTSGSAVNPLPFDPSGIKRNSAVIAFYLGYKF